jgi:hypothetical protein
VLALSESFDDEGEGEEAKEDGIEFSKREKMRR